MGKNAFEVREQMRQQNLKREPEPALEVSADHNRPGPVGLPAPKPKRKQCSLYLDLEMMERVKRVARARGVPIGAVIEACVKMSLDQMEG